LGELVVADSDRRPLQLHNQRLVVSREGELLPEDPRLGGQDSVELGPLEQLFLALSIEHEKFETVMKSSRDVISLAPG
jgi:hypothetical protein